MTLSTTDALCGAQPQSPEKAGGGDLAPSGLFGAINLSAIRVERMATAIIESMNRIQRVAG
jgi:hypothetical protein